MQLLDSISLRILGALIEKESTTPDLYPLTLNSLLNACNQKSSRNPVMSLTNAQVGPRLLELEKENWLRREYGSRAEHYTHRVNVKLNLIQKKLAILATLMLRGPQTLGEIRSHSARLYNFESTEAVRYFVDQLVDSQPPLVELMHRKPGESADRYQQLLSPLPNEIEALSSQTEPQTIIKQSNDGLLQRIENLEQRISKLEKKLDS